MGQLRIWHSSNLGNKLFTHNVSSIDEAKNFLKLLAEYDLYLKDKVGANAQGCEEFNVDEQEWDEWYCEQCGLDINYCIC